MEITISREEYAALVEAEVKLDLITKIAKAEERTYGYSSNVSEMIDTILGIKRDEK